MIRVPTITGIIDRRILINYRVDAEVMRNYLPQPFEPLLIKEKAIAGICLIRLMEIRPKGFPKAIGISSENGAHRIAVQWKEHGQKRTGVYIPRRDTSSKLNSLAGGRIFPGVHHYADFKVKERNGNFAVSFVSDDGATLSINASETDSWNPESIFENIGCASDFFKRGAIGYSPNKSANCFDGLELNTYTWQVSPLIVKHVQSGFFENEDVFPRGSVIFDNALLMKDIEHEWNRMKEIK